MTSTQIIAIVIFLVTMAAIMTEKLHRTVAAVAGALLGEGGVDEISAECR